MFTDGLNAINRHSADKVHTFGAAKLPLVSFVITNYNYAPYLKECIDSCLAQDYPLCEIILVDDCSSDGSMDICEAYGDKISVLRHEKNSGQLTAFFTGMDMVNGEFVVFVDADDFLDSDAVSAHLYLHLFERPQVGFSCLRNRQVSENSAVISDFHPDFQNNGKELTYIAPRVIHTPTWSWSTTSAMMFRSDLVKLLKTDMVDEFRVCADYYLVHFANLLGGSLLFDRAKVNYRRHGKNNFSKNFVIGGHRPTGHDKFHAHPAQSSLQMAILNKLINERAKFEPYFPSLERYAETILFVAPLSFILSNFSIDGELKNTLQKQASNIEKQKKEQISIKKWAIRWFELQNKYSKIKVFKNNLISLYGVREK